MKKILISGADGQLGSAFSMLDSDTFKVYSFNKKKLDITNIHNLEIILNKINPDCFINTAAYTNVDQSEKDINTVYAINHIAPANLAKVLFKNNIKFIHFSTDFVYDGKKDSLYNEDDFCNPLSIYGKSKLKGDLEVLKNNNKSMIFRVSSLYSDTGINFVNKIIELNKKKPVLEVVDDQFSIPTYAEDISILIKQIIMNDIYSNKFGIYNYCDDGKVVSKYYLAKYINEILKKNKIKVSNLKKISSDKFKTSAIRPVYSGLDKKKFKSTFNLNGNTWKINIEKLILKKINC